MNQIRLNLFYDTNLLATLRECIELNLNWDIAHITKLENLKNIKPIKDSISGRLGV